MPLGCSQALTRGLGHGRPLEGRASLGRQDGPLGAAGPPDQSDPRMLLDLGLGLRRPPRATADPTARRVYRALRSVPSTPGLLKTEVSTSSRQGQGCGWPWSGKPRDRVTARTAWEQPPVTARCYAGGRGQCPRGGAQRCIRGGTSTLPITQAALLSLHQETEAQTVGGSPRVTQPGSGGPAGRETLPQTHPRALCGGSPQPSGGPCIMTWGPRPACTGELWSKTPPCPLGAVWPWVAALPLWAGLCICEWASGQGQGAVRCSVLKRGRSVQCGPCPAPGCLPPATAPLRAHEGRRDRPGLPRLQAQGLSCFYGNLELRSAQFCRKLRALGRPGGEGQGGVPG